MPQGQPEKLKVSPPILLAQEEGHSGTSTTTHASEGHSGEKHHQPGEVPDAGLLFANSVLVALIMIGFALAARRQFAKVPRGLQNFAEYIVESMNNFVVGIIGHGGEKYTPLVGTVFLYILLANLIGQVPGFHSPTANLSLTLALGTVVFVYVQIQGILNNGVAKYFGHFMGPSITGKFPELFFLLGPIELVSEFIKPFTLAIRLFGNIFGEDVIIVVLATLGGTLGGSALGWLPVQFPLLLLAMLTAFVQAMVFSILTCIYLSLMASHDHGAEHGEDGAHDAAHSHATGH